MKGEYKDMSWLIESYLEEAPIDDFNHTNMRNYSKLKHSGKITDQDEKDIVSSSVAKRFKAGYKLGNLGAKTVDDAMKNKAVKNAIEHKYGKDNIKTKFKDTKDYISGDRERVMDKTISKTNDIITAKDATDRHNRRHPDRVIEDVDMLIELMQ